jgi:hypothetical protein
MAIVKINDNTAFNCDMCALNEKHYADILDATNKYNIAKARDGSTETDKVVSARAEITSIDSQYETDQLSIINKYYGA